jgi:glycerate-2-kinase
MIIKNIKELARNDLRRDALEIVEAGYQAIKSEDIFKNHISLEDDQLSIGEQSFNLKKYNNIYVVGVGKGSDLAAKAIEDILTPDRIKAGFVIDTVSIKLQKIETLKGTHPLPSEQNIQATEKITNLLTEAKRDDLVLVIICGGGSALFCKPGGLTCLELQFISSFLLRQGASIQEINTVRKHVSLIHGGYLAQYAYPAEVVSLVISDVVGDDLNFIASGPTVMDKTSIEDAQKIINKYQLPKIDLVDTPKDPKYFKRVTNIILGSGSTAVDGMKQKAIELGYKPKIYSREIAGMANKVGPDLAKSIRPGEALLACGETQVIVKHPGKGGRNQDVVLSAIPDLPKNSVIISAASDGKDNIEVAGAIADSEISTKELKQHKLDPIDAVDKNNGYNVLHRLNDHLLIDRVTANVSDFMLGLGGKE